MEKPFSTLGFSFGKDPQERILPEKKPKPSMSHLTWDPLKAWLPLPSQNLPIPAVALNEDGVTHLGSWMSL